MPGVRKSLFSAVAGTLVAAGLVVPGALNPASADTAANSRVPAFPTAPQAAPVKWSSQLGPVPRAATSTAPALMYELFPVVRERYQYELRLLLFWSDLKPGSGISYQSSISLPRNQWSPPAEVDGGKAVTNSQPSATPLNSPVPGQLIVAWTNRTNSRVMYSIGQPRPHYLLEWSLADAIPGAAASGGPAVYSPSNSDVVLVAWKSATGDAIDYSVGRLEDNDSRLVWQNFSVIPKASATSAPAIAEVSTSPDSGRIYVLWTGTGRTGPVDFATTADPLSAGRLKWTAPAALPASVRSGAAPAAQAIGTQASYALLVVYRALRGSALYYVTIAKGGKVSKPLEVPHLRSANGPALTQGVLAAQSPDPDSIFYQTYVRACAGC
jgi:hypothetical protein